MEILVALMYRGVLVSGLLNILAGWSSLTNKQVILQLLEKFGILQNII